MRRPAQSKQTAAEARRLLPVSLSKAILAALSAAAALAASPVSAATLNGHTVVLDGSGRIVPWTDDPAAGYDHVVGLAWNYLLSDVPHDEQTGQPAYYSRSYIDPDTRQEGNWPHNPAGLYSMLIESALKYFAYSGDRAAVDLAEDVAEALFNNGMTPSGWDWAAVPYASGDPGSLLYQGAAMGNASGIGDGRGVIEPDKVGEMGFAWLQLFRFTGNTLFRDAAIAAADALASHVRAGSETRSPWPFRVFAESGAVREDYCADVIGPISLFDGLIGLGLGDIGAYQAARDAAWEWLMTYPMQNSVWANYFEDIALRTDLGNLTQYNALMTARYLLEHPEYDADWESHVRGLIAWVEKTFAVPSYGAISIAEQTAYWLPMGSHTARYASVNALLSEKTGDAAAREKAYRALNWATYMARPNGVVIVGPQINQQWFTDGYGDYIRHFLTSFGAVPEWTPGGRNHLVRSSSIVRDVGYSPGSIAYTVADGRSLEVARVNFVPTIVTADGVLLERRTNLAAAGWTYDPALEVVRVRHDAGTHVRISEAFSAVTVTPGDLTLRAGTTQQFTAVGHYLDGGTEEITAQAAWSSSDTSVAVIDSSGYCTAVGPGNAVLTATLGGVSGSAGMNVQAAPDTTPPSVAEFLVPDFAGSRTFVISSFTASDDTGVTGYVITTSNVPPAADQGGWSATAPALYAVTADGTYTLYPWAKDGAGNVSELFAEPRTVVVDTTAPDAPLVAGTTPTNDPTPTWSWTSGGGNGTYRYKLDDGDLGAGATLTTATSYTPSSAQPDGIHTLSVQERDEAGNWSVTGSFAVTVDTAAPALAISAPSLAVANNGVSVTYTVTYAGADAVTLAAGHVTLNRSGTANGTVGVGGGGTAVRTVTISNITGFSGTLGITIQPGTAVDAAGNAAAGAGPSASFAVDNSSGDFDGDGVDAADALKALRITAGLDTPTGADRARGDVAPLVDGQRRPDGLIDLADVVAILRKAAGLPSWL